MKRSGEWAKKMAEEARTTTRVCVNGITVLVPKHELEQLLQKYVKDKLGDNS